MILGNIEAPAWVFQVILLVLAVGLAIALFLAWAFEITLDFAIVALLAVAAGYLAFDRFVLAPSPSVALDEAASDPATSQ